MYVKYVLSIVMLNLGTQLFAGEPGTSASHAKGVDSWSPTGIGCLMVKSKRIDLKKYLFDEKNKKDVSRQSKCKKKGARRSRDKKKELSNRARAPRGLMVKSKKIDFNEFLSNEENKENVPKCSLNCSNYLNGGCEFHNKK